MRNCVILIIFLLLTGFTQSMEPCRIYLIGDSTISDKEISAFPETGWGMPFKNFFDSTVIVENHAKNGRSTRTFLTENRWTPIMNKLKKGDYVFIQFGHNDESKEKVDRYTTPDEYKQNLQRFIKDARSKSATPVLITPVSRRKFAAGTQQETHAIYASLVKEVASQEKVVCFDLDTESRALYQQMGEENSKLLFLQLEVGEHPNYPEGKIDNTHFSELGARKIALLVLHNIRNSSLDLRHHISKPLPKK